MFRSDFQRRWAPLDASAVGILIVILWKASGRSWEVAFGAGAFFLMLIPLSPALSKYL
jgi:hypothetical protein